MDLFFFFLLSPKFRAKVSKYGDRVLEIIEAAIREHFLNDKNSSSSNGSTDFAKRRRSSGIPSPSLEDFEFKSTGRSKKMATNRKNNATEAINHAEQDDFLHYIDDELDFDDCNFEANGSAMKTAQNGNGRVLPAWSNVGNARQS